MPLTVDSSSQTASGAFAPSEVSAYQANPFQFPFTLPGSETFNGESQVHLELRKVGILGADGLLARVSSAANPTGNTLTLSFTSAQMNQPVPNGQEFKDYSLWLYATKTDVHTTLWKGTLHLYADETTASLTEDPPDVADIYLTKADADLLYDPLGGGGGGGATNITITPSPTGVLVASSSGTDGTISAADATNAGVFLPAEKTKLAGVATGATANSPDATLLARSNHTGTQSADTITDGSTNKAFSAAEKTKLSGIATGATANSPDATLLARANHTGTQSVSTITGIGTAATLDTGTSAGNVVQLDGAGKLPAVDGSQLTNLPGGGGGGGASVLDDLTDVAITSPATANGLMYSGTGWVNRPLVSGDISDASVAGAADNLLKFNGTGKVALSSGSYRVFIDPSTGQVRSTSTVSGSAEHADITPTLMRMYSSLDSKGVELARGSVEIVNASGFGGMVKADDVTDDRTFQLPDVAGDLVVKSGASAIVASDFALTAGTAAQPIFPSDRNRLTLLAGTYKFEMFVGITKSGSSTVPSIGFAASAGATISRIRYMSNTRNASVNTTGTPTVGEWDSASASNVFGGTASGSNCFAYISGFMTLSSGGDIEPQITFSVAPTSPTVQENSGIVFTLVDELFNAA